MLKSKFLFHPIFNHWYIIVNQILFGINRFYKENDYLKYRVFFFLKKKVIVIVTYFSEKSLNLLLTMTLMW